MTSLSTLRHALAAAGLCLAATAAGAADFTLLHAFDDKTPTAPTAPSGTLTLANDGSGLLYGVTSFGGHAEAPGYGTLYSVDPQGKVTTLHDFRAAEGFDPNGNLVQTADGALWGTTQSGGSEGGGTIFKLMPGGHLVVMHALEFFDGQSPVTGLTLVADGSLWGTTGYGGQGNSGTVFRIDQAGNFQVVRNFGDESHHGTHPQGRLVQAADGSVWGTTTYSAVAGSAPIGGGTIYKITPDGTFTLVKSFGEGHCSYGCRPSAGLTLGNDGWLYGTALFGGRKGGGTVFRINDSGFQVVHAFESGRTNGGSLPWAALTLGSNGSLYGTTYAGGSKQADQGPGTVFKIDTAGVYSQLHVFGCLHTGCGPHSGLVETSPGVFAGTVQNDAIDITRGGSVWQIVDR